ITTLLFIIAWYAWQIFPNNDRIVNVWQAKLLVLLAHSTFDRVAGYGLKYFDSFDHTHLGWIGKSKHLNKE
ncbi:MAG: DUF4260 family protein, partial [Sediminibacterium sp.]